MIKEKSLTLEDLDKIWDAQVMLFAVLCLDLYLPVCTGWPEKPGKVGKFDIGQRKVKEIRKIHGKVQRNCGLPVVYCRDYDSRRINTHNRSTVVLSKVDMLKMDCK